MIKVRCENCQQKLGMPESFAGKRVKCTKCGQPVQVPALAPEPVPVLDELTALDDTAVGGEPPPDDLEPAAIDEGDALSQLEELEPETLAPVTLAAPPPLPEGKRCPKCTAMLGPGAAICVNCGHNLLLGVNVQTVANARAAVDGAGRMVLGLILGGAAAVAGGVAWAVIAVVTGYSIGWIAWGIGLMVGLAVMATAKEPDHRSGLMAAGLAAGALLLGKLIIFWLLPLSPQFIAEFTQNDAAMRGLLTLTMAKNHTLPPAACDYINNGGHARDLDPATQARVAELVNAKYASMSNREKEALASQGGAEILSRVPLLDRIKKSLEPIDILWFGLALATAFRVGSGRRKMSSG